MKTEAKFPRMHVSLYVKDIKKTVPFYETFFGQKADKTKVDYAKFTLENPSLIISFVQNAEKVNSQFGHLGFQVASEAILKSKLEEMKSQRVELLEEMGTNCCYALQDKFWVSDPDGTMWEVYYFHEDAEFNDPRYATQEAAACCTPEPVTQEKEPCCNPASGCC